MTTLQQKLIISEGSIRWIKMITQWYKMTSVKSKYIASRFNDEDCKSFVYLSEICNTVSICIYEGARNRQRKLMKDTGNAFLITTKYSVLASLRS